jgi:hypothetical protein
MKNSLQELVQRTRGRDTGGGATVSGGQGNALPEYATAEIYQGNDAGIAAGNIGGNGAINQTNKSAQNIKQIQFGSLMNDTLSGRAANDARYECERRVA